MNDDRPLWQTRLAELLSGAHSATGDSLDAGAEITVAGPDGEAQTFALARHHRLEDTPGQTPVLWLRPIAGRRAGPAGIPAFDLDVARRHGFSADRARLEDGEVVLELADGASARIRPAGGAALADLADWDTFYYTAIDDETRTDLEDLYADSIGI